MIPIRPNIFVLCMHKAASTFVADVLLPSIAIRTAQYNLYNVGEELIRLREQELQSLETGLAWESASPHDQLRYCLLQRPLPTSNGLIGRLYPGHLPAIEQSLGMHLPNPSHRLVVVRRDPRDALVSLYYSLAVSHDPHRIEGNSHVFSQIRQTLQNQDIRDGLKSMLGIRGSDLTTNEFLECTRRVQADQNVCDLPYELLLNQPARWLREFLHFGGLDGFVDNAWSEQMLEHLQPPVSEDPTRHKRRMKPGNWIEVFDEELRRLVDRRVGLQMKQFGYVW